MKRQPLKNVDYACIVHCKTNYFRLPPFTTRIPIKSQISGGIFLRPDVGRWWSSTRLNILKLSCCQKNEIKTVHVRICGLSKLAHCFWKKHDDVGFFKCNLLELWTPQTNIYLQWEDVLIWELVDLTLLKSLDLCFMLLLPLFDILEFFQFGDQCTFLEDKETVTMGAGGKPLVIYTWCRWGCEKIKELL